MQNKGSFLEGIFPFAKEEEHKCSSIKGSFCCLYSSGVSGVQIPPVLWVSRGVGTSNTKGLHESPVKIPSNFIKKTFSLEHKPPKENLAKTRRKQKENIQKRKNMGLVSSSFS